jgi:hypothetical protein
MSSALGSCDDGSMAKIVPIVDAHAPFRVLARAPLQLEGFEVVGETAGRPVPRAPGGTGAGAGVPAEECSSLPAVGSSDQPITPP